jgi:catechol 2,3-dioxygenase-like lactoylglutathione lyase family enzyme
MRVELNHTIVHARDKAASAEFLADILDLPVGEQWGPFVPVVLSNGVTLDFADAGDSPIQSAHYAFLIDDELFDAAFTRIKAAGLAYYADPFHAKPNEINRLYGGRGLYFDDPDGHKMELMTVPYGDTPGG